VIQILIITLSLFKFSFYGVLNYLFSVIIIFAAIKGIKIRYNKLVAF